MTFRSRLGAFLDRSDVQAAIIGVIVFNAILLGLETSVRAMEMAGPAIIALDRLCLAIFTVELLLKLYARGPSFFRSGWNIFDVVVVGISYVPEGGGLSVLRALRILRVLRLLSAVPRLRRVIEGLFNALPGMASVFALMALIFYIASVIATKLFGASFPDWFGTLGLSAYSLFQIMTLESWSMGIVRPVMEVFPYAWAFFVPFIIITAFSVLNLFIGLLVNTMQGAVEAEEQQEFEVLRELVRSETDQVDMHVLELKEEISALRAELAKLAERRDG